MQFLLFMKLLKSRQSIHTSYLTQFIPEVEQNQSQLSTIYSDICQLQQRGRFPMQKITDLIFRKVCSYLEVQLASFKCNAFMVATVALNIKAGPFVQCMQLQKYF